MKTSIRISEAEWEIMNVVWRQEPVAANTIVEELREKKQWSLATVRTLLRRLVNKGAVGQKAEGKRYIYTALVSMEACVRQESESLWERVLGHAPSSALIYLVKRADLSKEDIQELKRILREKEE